MLGLLVAVAGFIFAEARAKDPIIPLSLFRNPIFVNATAIGLTLGIGMFAAIGFVPTFLQMSSGTSAAASGLLMLPMMVGLMGTSIASGILITKTGRYRMFPIAGTLVTGAAMVAMTTLTAATPIWLICVFLFVFGAGPRPDHAGRRARRAERRPRRRDRHRDQHEQLLPRGRRGARHRRLRHHLHDPPHREPHGGLHAGRGVGSGCRERDVDPRARRR